MKTHTSEPTPPHLSMDAYVDFVEAAFPDRDVKRALRQKELEERIDRPFTLPAPPR